MHLIMYGVVIFLSIIACYFFADFYRRVALAETGITFNNRLVIFFMRKTFGGQDYTVNYDKRIFKLL